jgi:signal peptidase II
MKRKYIVLLIISTLIVLLDQMTKLAVLERFRLGESVTVIEGFFNLTYVRNTGAAFGILAEAHPSFRIPFFLLVPVIALSAIAYIFRKIPEGDLKLASALALVVGGAIGNLIDRLAYGYVVDFLDFHWKYGYHFPAFNVADSAICVGVGVLMLDLLRTPETEQGKPNASDPV